VIPENMVNGLWILLHFRTFNSKDALHSLCDRFFADQNFFSRIQPRKAENFPLFLARIIDFALDSLQLQFSLEILLNPMLQAPTVDECSD
jgi:hypothetical protein